MKTLKRREKRFPKWISAGHPKCQHEGEYGDYCQICGCPLETVSLEGLV